MPHLSWILLQLNKMGPATYIVQVLVVLEWKMWLCTFSPLYETLTSPFQTWRLEEKQPYLHHVPFCVL